MRQWLSSVDSATKLTFAMVVAAHLCLGIIAYQVEFVALLVALFWPSIVPAMASDDAFGPVAVPGTLPYGILVGFSTIVWATVITTAFYIIRRLRERRAESREA